MRQQNLKQSGITFRSLAISCFSMLLLAILIQFFEVIEGSFMTSQGSIAQSPLAMPAVPIFLILLIVGSLFRLVTHRQLLSRPEALCVLFSLLIAAPIMSTCSEAWTRPTLTEAPASVGTRSRRGLFPG